MHPNPGDGDAGRFHLVILRGPQPREVGVELDYWGLDSCEFGYLSRMGVLGRLDLVLFTGKFKPASIIHFQSCTLLTEHTTPYPNQVL